MNLDGAPFGLKATGDAAWDGDSDDYAMFTAEGNAAVAVMVRTARLKTISEAEGAVTAWIRSEKRRLAADAGEYAFLPDHRGPGTSGRTAVGMGEVWDTMVEETIAYALDEPWVQAYGHRFGE